MIQYFKTTIFLAVAAAMLALAACTEDTDTLGVYDESDDIETGSAVFQCITSSIALDSVRANSDKCYIGQITDPETGVMLKADFAAQFHTFETGVLPPVDRLVCDEEGNIVCDSVTVRLFFQSYYGSGTAPFKLNVYELSMMPERMMREDSLYFTNVNLANFVATPEELEERKVTDKVFWPVSKVFTPIDYTETDSALTSSTHYSNICVRLPRQYGARILNLYRTNPEYFASSYRFIRNVCPGFYFNISDGNGAMMYVDVSSLDIYYRYRHSEDKVVNGVCRFAATSEVIQATHFEGGGNEALLEDESCTYLRSPAGIGTLVKLPVDEIFSGHERDSLALVSLHLMRCNVEGDRKFALAPCNSVAMVERCDMARFFERGFVRNPRAYAVAAYSSGYNMYSFSNIGRLVSYLHEKKRVQAQALGYADTATYAREHPEWNEVVLVPVTVNTNSNNQVVSINNDMSITSARLQGGKHNPLDIQVVYSKYKK